jgi:hypothetical protein
VWWPDAERNLTPGPKGGQFSRLHSACFAEGAGLVQVPDEVSAVVSMSGHIFGGLIDIRSGISAFLPAFAYVANSQPSATSVHPSGLSTA